MPASSENCHPRGRREAIRMRKEAALLIVLAIIGWCAAPASASSNVVAHRSLDESSGQ
jgi:hypothetical protein